MIGILSYEQIKEIETANKMTLIEKNADMSYLKRLIESANNKIATLPCRQCDEFLKNVDLEQLQNILRKKY